MMISQSIAMQLILLIIFAESADQSGPTLYTRDGHMPVGDRFPVVRRAEPALQKDFAFSC